MTGPLSMRLQEHVLQALRQASSLRAGDELLIGVSGGPDSVALLHLLVAVAGPRRLRLCVVHVDHQLRDDSAEDAAFVERLAASWQAPCVVCARDIRALARREKRSVEDAARRARYEAFLDVAKRRGASWLALAHTANDQAETVCMRFLRGAGLTGLSGMAPLRRFGTLSVIRPLLGIWRDEVNAYLREHHLEARQDPTNTDRRILRNRIRHELLPLLERDYNPNLKRGLVQLAEQCRIDLSCLEEVARRQWKRIARVRSEGDPRRAKWPGAPPRQAFRSRRDGGYCTGNREGSGRADEISLRLDAWARQPEALRRQLLRLAIQELQGDTSAFEHRHWEELEDLCANRPRGSIMDLPHKLQAQRGAAALILRRREPSAASAAPEPTVPCQAI